MRKFYTLMVSVWVLSLIFSEVIAQAPAPDWTKLYAGPTGKGASARLIKVANGAVYVAGTVNATSNTSAGIEVLKYDLSGGNRQVIAKYTSVTSLSDMEVDAAGNVYITAVRSAGLVGSGIPNDDFVTMKFNPDGSLAWATTYAGSLGIADQSRALAVDNSGNVFVTGFADGEPLGGNAVITIKYNSSGNQQWTARIDEMADLLGTYTDREEGVDIAVDGQGDVYITGEIGISMFVAKYAGSFSGTGNPVIWKKVVSEGLNGRKIIVKDGNVVASGFGGTIASYGLNGAFNWVQKYSVPGSTREADYWTMALDDAGNIYAAGGYNADFFVIKYNSAGIKQWENNTYGGTANAGDFVRGITLDGAGNVFVTGYLSMKEGRSTVTKIPVVKYNSSGTREWAALMNGDGFGIATDPAGSVYVTGQQAVKNIRNFMTIKYPCCVAQTISPISTMEESGLNSLNNFPNPFKLSTSINFRLTKAGYVSLNVFDLNGRRIQTLVQGQKNAGQHSVKFSGNNLPAGIYLYRLEADGYSKTGRMILEK